jgi:predicted ester cyclase
VSVEQNKALILNKHLGEVFHKGNLSVVDEIIHPDYVYHGPLGEAKGPEGFKQIVNQALTAFPDIHYDIIDMFGEGDKLAVHYRMTGTFKGALMGIPPTGNKVDLPQAFLYRFKDGKEVEALPFSDMLTMYQQMGIKPPG